jgi:hypothetical protein
MRNLTTKFSAITIGIATAFILAGLAAVFAPRPAMATAAMAKATGQPCAKCHTAVPALNSYGQKYKDSLKK